jgi:Outer membrane protein beta-barrel domain
MFLNFKHFIILVLFLSAAIHGNCQVKEGYFIKPDGDTIRGFMKAGPGRKLSDGLAYKENIKVKTFKYYRPEEVKEVWYDNQKYISALVSDPLINKTVLLKVLVEGSYNLYQVTTEQENVYYLFTDQKGDVQLMKKGSYYGSLKIGLPECSTIDFNDPKFLTLYKYNSIDLPKLFRAYNKCINPQQVVIEHNKAQKITFKKGIIAGVSNSTMTLTWPADEKANYGTYQNFNVGLFGEVGFNKHLSLSAGAELYRFEGQASFDYASLYKKEIDFSAQFLRVPLLLKYSLKGKLKPYINAGTHFNRLLGQNGNKKVSTIEYDYKLAIEKTNMGFTGGMGIALTPFSNSKEIKLEARYHNTWLYSGVNHIGALTSYQLVIGLGL